MRFSQLIVVLTLAKLSSCQDVQVQHVRSSYTAAVVEFSPEQIESYSAPNVTKANLKEFLSYIKKAKDQNADIVIFPEYGMTDQIPAINRDLARDFSQIVPHPSLKQVPCDKNNYAIENEAIKNLSCAARDNSIYVVVNLLEREECSRCSGDDLLIFNTNVAFDRTGTVVARYRKFNLFGEAVINTTKEPDISYFDTDFGARMGLMTCFDIIFERPAVTLVRDYNVTDIIFPSAWSQELPFLTALQTQAAWAYSLDVNLLASGFNSPRSGSSGSGIYGGLRHGAIASTIYQAEDDEMVVANIEGSPQVQSKPIPTHHGLRMSEETLVNYTSQLLPRGSDQNSLELCHGTFCCSITYQFDDTNEINHYHFIVYDGIRTHPIVDFFTNLQVCALVACSGKDKTSCSDSLYLSTYSLDIQFKVLKVNGENFKSDHVWPNTLLSDSIKPLNIQNFTYDKKEISAGKYYYNLEIKKPSKSIHTFGLYSIDIKNNSGVMLNIRLTYVIFLSFIALSLNKIS